MKNKTSFDCGPVAICNFFLNRNKKIGYKKVRKMCKTTKSGTYLLNFHKAFKKLYPNIKRLYNEKEIRQGDVVLYHYIEKEQPKAHYEFFYRKPNAHFYKKCYIQAIWRK